MGYSAAAGFRDIGSSTMDYIPEVWAGELLIKFYDNTVLGDITNTDYEGAITKQGDKVHIRTLPDITINTHRKGQTLDYEQPESTATSLDIDQGKSWSFVADRVDLAQTDIKDYVDKWTSDAAEQMKITIDTQILANVYSNADSDNQGSTAGRKSGDINLGVSGSPLEVTAANVIDVITDCGTVLDEENVPQSGRFMVVPPWFLGMIKKSDLKDASLAGDSVSIARNGKVGMIDRFMLYSSNLLTTTADGGGETATNIIFGTNHAITFASQLTENEVLPNPNGFGTLHRGLQVYGYKVVKAEALGWLYAYKG